MIAVDFDPSFMWVISIHEHAKGRKLPYAFQPSFRAYMPSEIYDEALMLYKKAKHFYGVNIGHFLLIYSIAGFAELEFVNHDKPEPCRPEKIIKLVLEGIKVGGDWYPYPPYEFFDTAEIIEGSKALIHEKRCSKLQKAAGKLKKEIATLRLTELSKDLLEENLKLEKEVDATIKTRDLLKFVHTHVVLMLKANGLWCKGMDVSILKGMTLYRHIVISQDIGYKGKFSVTVNGKAVSGMFYLNLSHLDIYGAKDKDAEVTDIAIEFNPQELFTTVVNNIDSKEKARILANLL